jgi:hypothetical protein
MKKIVFILMCAVSVQLQAAAAEDPFAGFTRLSLNDRNTLSDGQELWLDQIPNGGLTKVTIDMKTPLPRFLEGRKHAVVMIKREDGLSIPMSVLALLRREEGL